MTAPIVAFFNAAEGVGTTSLVYHLAWALADLGHFVLAADVDPQAALTIRSVSDERLRGLWAVASDRSPTVGSMLEPLFDSGDDVLVAELPEHLGDRIDLLPSGLRLARLESAIERAWWRLSTSEPRSILQATSVWRLLRAQAARSGAEIVLLDVGAGLGAVERAALLAADCVVVPAAGDLITFEGVQHTALGVLRWREAWERVRSQLASTGLQLPTGTPRVLGYVDLLRPARSAGAAACESGFGPEQPQRLGLLHPYVALDDMAREARKPVFHLLPADGALAAHAAAVEQARAEYATLARRIADVCGLAS